MVGTQNRDRVMIGREILKVKIHLGESWRSYEPLSHIRILVRIRRKFSPINKQKLSEIARGNKLWIQKYVLG